MKIKEIIIHYLNNNGLVIETWKAKWVHYFQAKDENTLFDICCKQQKINMERRFMMEVSCQGKNSKYYFFNGVRNEHF